MAKYTNVDFTQDILNRPNIDKLLNKVKSLKGVRLKDKIDFRYLNTRELISILGFNATIECVCGIWVDTCSATK